MAVTRLALCPLTQAELMCSALGFNMKNIPLCERLLMAWLDAKLDEIRQRTVPDGEEICETGFVEGLNA